MATIQNKGRLNNFISGITGVQPGGTAVLNMPVNLRVHRMNFQCSGIGYGLGTTPTAVPATADAGATFAVTATNGQITAIAITGTVSTKGDGSYPLTITDGLYTMPDGSTVTVGRGATATYTVASNVVTATTITSPGTVGPVPAEIMITSIKQLVNGSNIRDITVDNILQIICANPAERNYNPVLGEFPIFFTEPWRNIIHHNELTSWDLFGQNTWQFQISISPAISNPSLVGSYEFDYMRNVRPAIVGGKTQMVPFLQPIAQHQFTYPVPSGRFDLTTLPIDFPISRMWCYETDINTGVRLGKGSIYQLELYQDGNKILETTLAQNDQIISEYGFNTNIYDAAFVADPDQRLNKALKVLNNMILRVYSTAPANLTVVMETLPGAYQ